MLSKVFPTLISQKFAHLLPPGKIPKHQFLKDILKEVEKLCYLGYMFSS